MLIVDNAVVGNISYKLNTMYPGILSRIFKNIYHYETSFAGTLFI